jgi:transposase-like protein
MSVMRRKYSPEFKVEICERIELSGEGKLKTCRENSLSPSLVDYWLAKYRESGSEAFSDGSPVSLEARVKELEASLGRAHLENEFLRDALGKLGIPVKRSP